MRALTPLLLLTIFIVSVSCARGASDGATPDSGEDAWDLITDVLVDLPEVREDTPPDPGPDLLEDPGADVPPLPPREYTFRAIGGVSMGANAFTIAAGHPGAFDITASLGGYTNPMYYQRLLKTVIFGGLCDMDTLLAHLDEINDEDSEVLDCRPNEPPNSWEFLADINHWPADESGGDFDRGFYYWALEGLFMIWGNILTYNPEHPWLPPGVPVEWPASDLSGAQRCANPLIIGTPYNYNAEYNPDGEYDLITICDGDGPVPVDEDDPDYFYYKGKYYADYTYTSPINVVLAVDYNGNGRRDFHEPVVINNMERLQDLGVDGCTGADEDGAGGCTGGGEGKDPNGDDFRIPENVFGTEGNDWRDGDEAYEDFGLDGVDGTGDFGEGDQEWSVNPNLLDALSRTPMHWLDNAPVEEIEALDILMDGGIRDSIHAAAATYPYYAHLAARGVDTRLYGNYSGSPDALLPTSGGVDFPTVLHLLELGAADIGKNLLVVYGDEDATEAEIKAGDGKHVGDAHEIVNRLATFIVMALQRWPDPDNEPCDELSFGSGANDTFYSPAMQTRYRVSYSLPPCYDKEGWEDKRYPLLIFLSGHGMEASTSLAGSIVFNILAKDGTLPKFIMAVPAGECCEYDREAGKRYCACESEGPNYLCVDPDCTGPHAECDIVTVPKSSVDEECNGGNFFTNHVSNRWGDVEAAETMQYGEMVMDLMAYLENEVRLKDAAVY
ncbi:MAG: hypothetical protein ABIK09_07035 [Pseudomonadota bacterium]